MDGQIVALAIEILLYLAKVWGREGRLEIGRERGTGRIPI